VKNILFITMLLGVGYSQSAHLEIQNVNINEGTLDVYMTNDVPVTGFQFQVGNDCGGTIGTFCNDDCCNLTVVSATGGEIVPDDWLTFGSGVWNNIMGYSIDPNLMIPAGEGVLVTVSFTDYNGEEICIQETDEAGTAYDFPLISGAFPEGEWTPITVPCTVGDCITCDIVDDCGVCGGDNSTCSGCTDSSASNYDENATIDDDSCEYNDDCEEVFNEGYELGAQSGDTNLDGTLNILDIIVSVNMILNP